MALGYAISYVAEAEVILTHDETPSDLHHCYWREAMAFKHLILQDNYYPCDLAHNLTTNISSELYHAAQQA